MFVGILLLGHGRIMIEGLVSYPSRTTITTGVSDDIHRIEIDDTKNSLGQMLIVGPSTFLSIEKNSTRDYSTLVRGIEAVALLKETTKNKKSSGYGSLLVVACSRRNLRSPGNAPIGSITLVQKIASKNAKHDAIAKALVPSKNLQGPTILIREVNGRDVKVIDVDKDGHLDIIASVSGISEGGKLAGFLLYLQNDGKNNFAKIQFVSESLNGKAVIGVGDCDQNGFVDIAVLGIDSKQLSVFYQIENTKFIEKLIGKC